MPLVSFLPPENRKPRVNGFARIFSNSVCTVKYNDQKESRLLLYILREDNLGKIQKPPSRGVLRKRCSENMQQSYRRTLMPKCDFNKVACRIY